MDCYNFTGNSYIHINQCYDRVFKPYHVMKEIHKHIGFEIMYVVNGKISVEFYDNNTSTESEVYHLFPGDFIFLDSGRYHRLVVDGTGAHIINVQCSPVEFPEYDGQHCLKKLINFTSELTEFFECNPGTFRLYDNGDFLSALQLMTKKFFKDSENKVVCDSLLIVFLCEVAGMYIKSVRAHRNHLYLRKAVFLIEDTMGNINPDRLSEEVGLSHSYLHKLFKNRFSKSISEYICEYKINRACYRFSCFPEIKVSAMAEEMGYKTLLGFERAFKRVKGIGPNEYKQSLREASEEWIVTRRGILLISGVQKA